MLQEIGLYNYGWRQYMPDIARWNGIDQLAENYHSASPYAYVLNNPISLADPDGRIAMAPQEPPINNVPQGSLWFYNRSLHGSVENYLGMYSSIQFKIGGGGGNITMPTNTVPKAYMSIFFKFIASGMTTDKALEEIQKKMDEDAGLNHAMHMGDGPGPKKSEWMKKYKELAKKQMLTQQKSKGISTDVLNRKDIVTYSNTMTVKDVGNFFQDIGDWMSIGGYSLTLTGYGAPVGILTSTVGNIVSTGGSIFNLSDAYLRGDYAGMGKIIGFQALNIGTGHLPSRVQGFNTLGKEVFKQNVGLKVMLLEKWYDHSNNKK